jgi:peptidoglycan/LPS O-acetylase OafA/YrhL
MGFLRFFLAALVVYTHCKYPFGRFGVSGENAVQIFYMISGFYMTLVLRERYATGGNVDLKAFYLNRWLRLYPAYLVVAAAAMLLCLGSAWLSWRPDAARYLSDWYASGLLDLRHAAWLVASQMTMLGLDSFNLFGLSPQGQLALNAQGDGYYPLWRLLLVPQAWSLSVEIYFYIVAPFVVTRGLRSVLGFALASYAIRLVLWAYADLHEDPWSYRFFPSELMFFLAGSLAYRLYANDGEVRALGRQGKAALRLAVVSMLVSAVWLGKLHEPLRFGAFIPPVVTAAVFIALPRLFRMTRHNHRDRVLGELSYPIYISHALMISLVGQGSYYVGGAGFLLAGGLTLLAAYALYRFVDQPIDAFRQGRSMPGAGLAAQPT